MIKLSVTAPLLLLLPLVAMTVCSLNQRPNTQQ